MSLIVENLPEDYSQETFTEEFKKFGECKIKFFVKLTQERSAFVEYQEDTSAGAAISTWNNQSFDGSVLRVEENYLDSQYFEPSQDKGAQLDQSPPADNLEGSEPQIAGPHSDCPPGEVSDKPSAENKEGEVNQDQQDEGLEGNQQEEQSAEANSQPEVVIPEPPADQGSPKAPAPEEQVPVSPEKHHDPPHDDAMDLDEPANPPCEEEPLPGEEKSPEEEKSSEEEKSPEEKKSPKEKKSPEKHTPKKTSKKVSKNAFEKASKKVSEEEVSEEEVSEEDELSSDEEDSEDEAPEELAKPSKKRKLSKQPAKKIKTPIKKLPNKKRPGNSAEPRETRSHQVQTRRSLHQNYF